MAKIQLTTSFRTLQKCVDSLSFRTSEAELEANRKLFVTQVSELKKFIEEAEVEPNFWFLPLHSSCYSKLFNSLSTMADFFAFSTHARKNLEQNSSITEDAWKKLAEKLDGDLEKFKEMVNASINCYADVTSLKSLKMQEKEAAKNEISSDIEMGKPQNMETNSVSGPDEMEMEKMVNSFLQHSGEIIDHIAEEDQEGEDSKSEGILNLSSLAFCLSGLMRETREIGKAIRELIQWENPSSHVNLEEITRRRHALQK